MSLRATAVIQAAPNAIIMTSSATEATTQDSRVSMVEVDCSTRLVLRFRSSHHIAASSFANFRIEEH